MADMDCCTAPSPVTFSPLHINESAASRLLLTFPIYGLRVSPSSLTIFHQLTKHSSYIEMKFNNLVFAVIAIACSSCSLFVSAFPMDVSLIAWYIGSPINVNQLAAREALPLAQPETEPFLKRLNPQPLPPGDERVHE